MAFVDTKGDWSQRNQRRGQMFTDQHGRKYFASIELKTGATCGVVEAQYQCPLPVPAMYLERSPDLERPYDFVVNYKRWEQDIRLELDDWMKRARSLAIRRYGPEYDVSKPFSPDILEAVGPAPQAVEPVIAARQGNSWILFGRGVPHPKLVKFFAPEALDPDYVSRNEPNFRDEALSDLEEQYDPHALGGKRIEVGKPRSKEAERKAVQRAKKQQAAAPELQESEA